MMEEEEEEEQGTRRERLGDKDGDTVWAPGRTPAHGIGDGEDEA